MSRLVTAAGVIAIAAVSMAFAALNRGQHVTLYLGFITLYRVSLTTVAFSGLIGGMLIMFVAGIRSDLKVRRILRARLRQEDEEERARFVDHTQRDLFETGSPDEAVEKSPPEDRWEEGEQSAIEF